MIRTFYLYLFLSSLNTFGQVQADSHYIPKNVAILLFNEVELLDFAGPGEVFQQAEWNGKKAFNVYTVGIHSNEILSQGFLKVTTQYRIDDCPIPEILIIPGGNTISIANDEKLISWLALVNKKAEYMLTVCNGVRLLAKTGALDGKSATSHYGSIKNLIRDFPNINIVTGKRFVDNGRIITTEGVSAGIDGSLYLVSKILNDASAEGVAKIMMYSWRPEALDYLNVPLADTSFENRISAFCWMPDGQSILFNVLKLDKTKKAPPVLRNFKYNILTKKTELLQINGGGMAVSPDGKKVAFIKNIQGMDEIFLYDFDRMTDTVCIRDTLKKFAVSWSPDGKGLVYNIRTGQGKNGKVEIYTYNLQSNKRAQITNDLPFKSYAPSWNLSNDKIVYTAEKGDQHDQIYLTDRNGSYHKNLTRDITTHNFSPIWMNNQTIIFLQAPGDIMTINIDGSQKRKIDGIRASQFRFNTNTNEIIYLDPDENLVLYDMKARIQKLLIKPTEWNVLFNEF
ncbi:MAG: DJ-1/PfpI family protein [Saprospiraceae bacterium]|nr:DJ-1/PfpI family protein [Saprospiraceae bacterium]